MAAKADGAHRKSPVLLGESPRLAELLYYTVSYVFSRIVSACRGGVVTLAAGGTSQATSAMIPGLLVSRSMASRLKASAEASVEYCLRGS